VQSLLSSGANPERSGNKKEPARVQRGECEGNHDVFSNAS
jgi:hypothetical protein